VRIRFGYWLDSRIYGISIPVLSRIVLICCRLLRSVMKWCTWFRGTLQVIAIHFCLESPVDRGATWRDPLLAAPSKTKLSNQTSEARPPILQDASWKSPEECLLLIPCQTCAHSAYCNRGGQLDELREPHSVSQLNQVERTVATLPTVWEKAANVFCYFDRLLA